MNGFLIVKVAMARKKYNIQYPYLYAPLGHKFETEFNSVQRGTIIINPSHYFLIPMQKESNSNLLGISSPKHFGESTVCDAPDVSGWTSFPSYSGDFRRYMGDQSRYLWHRIFFQRTRGEVHRRNSITCGGYTIGCHVYETRVLDDHEISIISNEDYRKFSAPYKHAGISTP